MPPLLLLLVVFLLVVGIYLLRPPPVRLTVPSTLLWRPSRRATRRQQIRRWLLSLIGALVLAGLLAAALLGGPWFRRSVGEDEGGLAIVVDDGPTLGALRRDGGTRLDAAGRVARRLLAARGTDELLLADTCGRVPSAWRSPAEAREAIGNLIEEPPSACSRPRFPQLPGDPTEVILITDGVACCAAPAHLADRVRQVSVFEPADNVGIRRFEVRPQPGDPGRFEAWLEVHNASSGPQDVELELSDGRAVARWGLRLAAGQIDARAMDVSDFGGSWLRLALRATSDALAADDTALALLPRSPTLRVYLVRGADAPRPSPLATLLGLDPRVELVELSPGEWPPAPPEETEAATPRLVLFDRAVPAQPPSLPSLLIAPPGPPAWLADLLPPRPVEPDSPDRVAPDRVAEALFSPFDPAAITVSGRRTTLSARVSSSAPTSGALEILWSDAAGPLLLGRGRPTPLLLLTFPLEASSLPAHPSFPLFVRTLLERLRTPLPSSRVAPGVAKLEIASASTAQDLVLLSPDGAEVPLVGWPGGLLVDTRQEGRYLLSGVDGPGTGELLVDGVHDSFSTAINDSTLAADSSAGPELGDLQTPSPVADLAARIASDRTRLILLFLLLGVVEWWTFHRRITE